ncbi:tetratricopeptide repeat protein [Gimesia sp.]|uniref:tetratricopeptide repeat protein n=1 Tax=Gimesia sp. TaxID=2024833 RepID=UPI000C5C5132|nr:tetratricopeptide repeat protein [Gimesia sp.]MAX39513.1 hypothetical protein [Gimesia sp.]HAH49217.1 hypothetical protein [Planctomycetaceae bacterium]HBL42200.1 hypothetical protein [Planctomycetaceae bacterium]|tara:strand:- start:7548 stop:9227 length:1680 start_codon:yes stop_codon:yes gene_type:complete
MTRKAETLSLLAVVSVISALYGSYYSNTFLYDDSEQVLAQQPLESFDDLILIFTEPSFPTLPYYRPLTRASIMLQKTLHGDDARWFHLFNAILAGITVGIAWLLIRLPLFKILPVPALFAVALFGLHPAASSCVYPVASGRETLLPAALILLSTWCFLKGSQKYYWWSVVTCGLALLAKEQAIVLPVLFVTADLLNLTGLPEKRQLAGWFRRYLPFLLLLAGYLLLRWLLFSGTEVKLMLAEQPLGPFYSLLYALQTSFVPFVELVYEPPVEVWFDPLRILIAVLLTGILVYFVWRKSEELGRSACFWGGWFLLLMLPTSNILEQECAFSERYVFLSVLAPLALSASMISQYWDRFLVRKLFMITGLVAGVCLACISGIRGIYFENEETFFRQWVNTNPRSSTAHVHLGLVYASHEQFAEALACYERALAIDPEFTGALINQANALVTMQQYDPAIELYQRSLELLDGKLQHLKVGVYHNLGNAWWGKRDAEQAIQSYERAIKLSREHLPSYLALADIYLQQDQPAHAARYLNEALKLDSMTKQKQREIHNVMQRFQLE